jgi:hypothetical protein
MELVETKETVVTPCTTAKHFFRKQRRPSHASLDQDSQRRNQQAERRSQQHDFSRSCIVDTVDGGGAGLAVRVLDRGEGEIGLRGRRLQTQSTGLDRMVVGANSADGHFCQRTDRYCVNDGCERERNLRRNRPTSPKRPAPNRKRLLGSAVVMVSKSMAMYA